MEIHIKIIGVLFIALALSHLTFPKYFKWESELESLSLINKEMMIVHTFFVALVVFLMGLLCVGWSDELVNTEFGKVISLGFGVFWFLRLLIQFFGYSSSLWRGKTLETGIHILFSCFWFYTSFIFIYNFLSS